MRSHLPHRKQPRLARREGESGCGDQTANFRCVARALALAGLCLRHLGGCGQSLERTGPLGGDPDDIWTNRNTGWGCILLRRVCCGHDPDVLVLARRVRSTRSVGRRSTFTSSKSAGRGRMLACRCLTSVLGPADNSVGTFFCPEMKNGDMFPGDKEPLQVDHVPEIHPGTHFDMVCRSDAGTGPRHAHAGQSNRREQNKRYKKRCPRVIPCQSAQGRLSPRLPSTEYSDIGSG